MGTIEWADFERVEMHVGRILEIEDFTRARKPSYLLKIDFGSELGVKQSSAAIRDSYTKEDLLGKLVVAVTNFPPKQIANKMSEVLVLAAVSPNGSLRLIRPEGEVELGSRIL